MAVFTFPVPEGLLDLLRDFTVAVVHNEPDDLDRYAAEYFRDLAAAVDHARSASVECSKSRSYLEFDESIYVGFVRSDHGMDEFGTSQGSQRSVAESQRSGEVTPEEKEKCPDLAEKCLEKMRAEGTWPADADKPDCAAMEAIEAMEAAGARVSTRASDIADREGSVAAASSKVSGAVEGGDSTANVRDSTVRDSTVRDSTVRDSTVRDSTVRDSTVRDSTVADQEARESAVRGTSEVRESTARGASMADESKVRDSTVRESTMARTPGGSTTGRDSSMKTADDDVHSVKSEASAK